LHAETRVDVAEYCRKCLFCFSIRQLWNLNIQHPLCVFWEVVRPNLNPKPYLLWILFSVIGEHNNAQCDFSSAADSPTGYGKRKISKQVFMLGKALASGFFIPSYALYRTGG
jgi:hypothetical protein